MSESSVNLIKTVNELQDKLNPLGINKLAFDLPQIAVIGGQSAGKSSVLESFIGKEILPRGNNIVTRRPLVLQLINIPENEKAYGEFLHLSGKKFFDFNEIRDEISNETDREVKNSEGISAKPINLKIFSPDVLDLTLVDLPGITRVPVGNQPKDIEKRIEDMILEYIKNDNCLILAVTGANQDLATSDALKLAERVDPNGERTIGVLTKLDRMDDGTDARDILTGKHDIKLKRGFIGVINRSQKEIDANKSMKDALDNEQRFFSKHKAYHDMANKMGINYLQKHLHEELSKHISKLLPPLKQKFQNELVDINNNLTKIKYPADDHEKERILAQTNDDMRKLFESSTGGKTWKVSISRMSGGAKINLLMNSTFANEINNMTYDENRMKSEIATAIQNFYGVYLGVFTPDAAFRAVVENQIELFRKPSLNCVDGVTLEIQEIIREIIESIKGYPRIRELFAKFTLDFVHNCKIKCKSFIEHFVDAEKAYINTLHDDFIKFSGGDNQKPISESQLKATAQVVENQMKSDWITYEKKKYWFVIDNGFLSWFKDEAQKTEKGKVDIREAQFKKFTKDDTLTLIFSRKLRLLGNSEMSLVFGSTQTTEKWKDWLEKEGVKPIDGDGDTISMYNKDMDDISVSNYSMSDSENSKQFDSKDMALPEHMSSPVAQVKTLVDSYVTIMKKKFKDAIPRLCVLELIDSTANYISIDLRVQIREQYSDIDDIIGVDPEEQMRDDLSNRLKHYSEAIDIIEKFSKH